MLCFARRERVWPRVSIIYSWSGPLTLFFFCFFFVFLLLFFESQNEGYMSYSAKGPSSTSCQNETPSVSGPDPFPPRAKNRERVWLRETNLYIRLSFSLSS